MNALQCIKDILNRVLYGICIVIMVVLVIDVTWQVLSRYALGSPSTFTDEAARFLMVWMTFLGGAYMFGSNSHLSVTSLRDIMPRKCRDTVIIATYVLIAVFAASVMFYGSFRLIKHTLNQPSPSLGMPMGWFYTILPISAVCIIIYMVINIAEYLNGTNSLNRKEEAK
jgi:TRAP-type C4-dicarboxylate transport system permease small subunit